MALGRPTGVPSLDRLLRPTRRGWVVEVYGWWEPVRLVMHRAIASAASRGGVAVVHVQDFGGLDPYLLRRLLRLAGASEDRVLVARAFRLQDVPGLIEEAAGLGVEALVVSRPYYYSPRDPAKYWLLTPITAALRRAASQGLEVLVFNQASKHGRGRMPEGGTFHHHTAHIVARLSPYRRGVLAELIKHPARPVPARSLVSWAELEVGWVWGGQRPLLEYL